LFELAKLSYNAGNYEKTRQYLTQILSNPDCAQFRAAEEMAADIYYSQKNYSAALTHYLAAWDYSKYYEYKYKIAYKAANCYYKLNDPNNTQRWYKKFLDYDWQPEKNKAQVEYARKYTGLQEITMKNSTGQTPQTKNVQATEPNKPQTPEPNNPKVKLQTTLGDIVVELNAKAAPVTVKNFLRYVEDGFFDGTIFHRVIPDFMIQGGGFTPDMQQKQTHEPIANEASNGLKNDRGTIAMARTNNPNSATCQFFINLKNNAFLNYAGKDNPGYAVFGKVVEGMDIVDKIAAVPTATKGPHADVPVTTIVIRSAKVITGK
jgi:cyclophilin family peptidyl-prolyl cis-trans isomerase